MRGSIGQASHKSIVDQKKLRKMDSRRSEKALEIEMMRGRSQVPRAIEMSTIVTQKENHISRLQEGMQKREAKKGIRRGGRNDGILRKYVLVFSYVIHLEQIEIQRDLTYIVELRYSAKYRDNLRKKERYEVEVSTLILGLNLLNFRDEIIFFRWSEL